MRFIQNKKISHISLSVFIAASSLLVIGYTQRAHAATMSETFVRFDHMMISTATTGTVCAMPTTTSTDVKSWTVTFPTGYSLNATAGNWQSTNISTTNLSWPGTSPAPTAWPNATSATASISGQDVTWTNGTPQTMTAGTMYCYNWTNTATVTVKSSATSSNLGSITTKNSSAATIDTGDYATASITNDTITITASVPVAFSFSLTNPTETLTLSATAITSSSPTHAVTVNTNAKNGWLVWAKDSNTGLHSAAASYTIPANTYSGAGPTTVTATNEGYNMGVTSTQAGGSGTLTVDPGFLSAGAGQGGGLTTSFHSIATSTGSADNAVLTLTNNAAAKASTPAATDYTDTITVVGAGLF